VFGLDHTLELEPSEEDVHLQSVRVRPRSRLLKATDELSSYIACVTFFGLKRTTMLMAASSCSKTQLAWQPFTPATDLRGMA
jgi:hypothetical protein